MSIKAIFGVCHARRDDAADADAHAGLPDRARFCAILYFLILPDAIPAREPNIDY